MLVICLFLEIHARFLYQFAQERRLYLQFHLLVLHLAELQQLIHHAQHALAVTLNDLQLAAYILIDSLGLKDILHRRDDQRQRGAQLMTDVREKAQLDIRHLLLHFHFLTQTVIHRYHEYDQGYSYANAEDI